MTQARSSLPPLLASGTRIAQFTILDALGTGGLGAVYRAHDGRLKRHVAVKVLRQGAAPEEWRQRFVREAEIASSFNHPNIVTIYDVGTSDGVDYIAMELVAGSTLRELIPTGGLDLAAALGIAVQIADALATLHDARIVHRDLKPTNVIVTEGGLVKVLDFGLAKGTLARDAGDSVAVSDLTSPGMLVGTFAYMSPEQAEGRSADNRSDVFAFGALLYEMLCGQPAFSGANELAVLAAVRKAAPVPITDLAPDVPRELQTVIDRCLQKDGRRRWQSMADVKLLLEDVLESIRAEGSVYDPTRKLRSPRREQTVSSGVPSIGVLPFWDMSPQRDQEYFCEGISEELINALAGVAGIRVAARSAAFQFKGVGLDIRKIGDQLGVQTVLEGSVRKAGSRLRIVAQLVNVRDGYQLWSDRYDRELDDVFTVQDEIAHVIVSKLKVQLAAETDRELVKRHTEDIEAYNLYLEGRYYWSRRYAGFLQRAIDCFEQAIARDPSYAQAHAGLAEAFSLLGVYAILPPKAAIAKAKLAAERAVALDSSLAEAHQAMALVRWYFDWDFDAALQHYEQAIARTHSSGVLHGLYGILLADLGRFDEAVAEATSARMLEPVSALVGFYAASTLAIARPLEHALRECDRVLNLDPGFLPVLWVQSTILSHLNRHREAIDAATRAVALSGRQRFFLACAASAYARAGQRKEAETIRAELHEVREHSYVSPLCLAEISAALGEVDDAFTWLEAAVGERTPFLVALGVSPAYDPLRNDQRFAGVLRRVGLEGVKPAARRE